MGLKALIGTSVYDFVYTCIPRKEEIITTEILSNYDLSVKRRYLNTLGTMCDYGLRALFPHKDFAYIQIGVLRGIYPQSYLNILEEDYMSAYNAYILATKEERKPGEDLRKDYAELVDRAYQMYSMLTLRHPYFGKFYLADGEVHSFECDCITDDSVYDTKISYSTIRRREYWTQVLLYSLLSKRRDKISRRRIGLVYPVQGIVKQFTYDAEDYSAMYSVFNRMYEEEIVWK